MVLASTRERLCRAARWQVGTNRDSQSARSADRLAAQLMNPRFRWGPVVLFFALTAHDAAAVGAVRAAVGGVEIQAADTFPFDLGSLPLGSIQAFSLELCFVELGSPPRPCEASGTVSVLQPFAAPFHTAGFFLETIQTGVTVPVVPPVNVGVGQRLIIVDEWIATTLGPATGSQILHITSPNEPPVDLEVIPTATATAPPPCGFGNPGLCLAGNRFRVQAHFVTHTGDEDGASALGLTADTGYFFFFDPSNVEAVLKVLDGCGINGRHWVFAGGLTDVRTEITVTDLEHDAVKVYINPLGTPFQPIQDTSAFATCP